MVIAAGKAKTSSASRAATLSSCAASWNILQAAGIRVEVVNAGITAGLAWSHQLTMPLTHRQSVRGIGVRYRPCQAQANSGTDQRAGGHRHSARLTLVIYMGDQRCRHQHRLSAACPANCASGRDQNASRCRRSATSPPHAHPASGDYQTVRPDQYVVIVVGDVVGNAGAAAPTSEVRPAPGNTAFSSIRLGAATLGV
jgi:uroporphyrin-III C-methyltransferase